MRTKNYEGMRERARSTKELVEEMFLFPIFRKFRTFGLRIFCIPISTNWSIKTQIIVSLLILYLVAFFIIAIVLIVNIFLKNYTNFVDFRQFY